LTRCAAIADNSRRDDPVSARDLIYSGTPAGVGPVKPGDKLEGHVDGVGDLTVTNRRS